MPRQERHIPLSRSGSTLASGCFKLTLSQKQIYKLSNIGRRITLRPSHQLVPVGSTSNSVFILREGSAEVLIPHTDGTMRCIRTVVPGEMLGLTEMLAGSKYCFCVRATTNSVFTEIHREELVKFLQEEPGTCFELVSMMATAFIDCLHAAISIDQPKHL